MMFYANEQIKSPWMPSMDYTWPTDVIHVVHIYLKAVIQLTSLDFLHPWGQRSKEMEVISL